MNRGTAPRRLALAFAAAAAGAALSSLAAPTASADPVTVPGFSFEEADVPDDATGAPAGWVAVNGGVYDPTDEGYPGATGDNSPLPAPAVGGQVGWHNVTADSPVGSLTSAAPVATVADNTQYTLTVAIGDRATDLGGGVPLEPGLVTIELLVDGAVAGSGSVSGTALADGTFTDLSATFTTTASDPRAGGGLTIRLRQDYAGPELVQQANFDNVRLDATPIPEPAAALSLGVLAMGGLLVRRRGRQARS